MTDLSRRVMLAWALLDILAPLGASHAAGETSPGGERVALKGYDPVSYFNPGHPEKGSAEYTAAFNGSTYWFTNAEHKALFVANPDHYAPMFNGYCTVQVSRGVKYEADPEAWAITDGKLWVFGGKKGEAVFREQTPAIIAKAAENWPEVREKTVSQTPVTQPPAK